MHKRELKRRKPSRDPRKTIYVYCEGRLTEPEYFRSLSATFRNSMVRVETVGNGGLDPFTLVREAVRAKSDLERSARRSGDSFDRLFEVWAVFDVDEHPRVPDARQTARANGVRIAMSNPCFELWCIYHFSDFNGEICREDAVRRLAGFVPHYGRPRKVFRLNDCGESRDQQLDALRRAIRHGTRGLESRRDEGQPGGCPSSECHELAKMIAGEVLVAE